MFFYTHVSFNQVIDKQVRSGVLLVKSTTSKDPDHNRLTTAHRVPKPNQAYQQAYHRTQGHGS